jgi:hypothetical protein
MGIWGETEPPCPAPLEQSPPQEISTALISIPAMRTQQGRFVRAQSLFPLSRDHLLPLVEYNVFRATMTNILIVGHVHLLNSALCCFDAQVPTFPTADWGENLPPSLMPTKLQRCTPHADWIDLLPCPRMRDNAIRMRHRFSNIELVADILNGMCDGGSPSSHGVYREQCRGGLIVWSNPWEPAGWEVTEVFIRKWGFLVEGCRTLYDAADRWRALRGEEPLNLALRVEKFSPTL